MSVSNRKRAIDKAENCVYTPAHVNANESLVPEKSYCPIIKTQPDGV